MKWTPIARKEAIMWRVNKCGSADFKDVAKKFAEEITAKGVKNDRDKERDRNI